MLIRLGGWGFFGSHSGDFIGCFWHQKMGGSDFLLGRASEVGDTGVVLCYFVFFFSFSFFSGF